MRPAASSKEAALVCETKGKRYSPSSNKCYFPLPAAGPTHNPSICSRAVNVAAQKRAGGDSAVLHPNITP